MLCGISIRVPKGRIVQLCFLLPPTLCDTACLAGVTLNKHSSCWVKIDRNCFFATRQTKLIDSIMNIFSCKCPTLTECERKKFINYLLYLCGNIGILKH